MCLHVSAAVEKNMSEGEAPELLQVEHCVLQFKWLSF